MNTSTLSVYKVIFRAADGSVLADPIVAATSKAKAKATANKLTALQFKNCPWETQEIQKLGSV